MFLWMHFHAWQTNEREGGEELVAEGSLKTDSASNSNDDKHERIEARARAGARVE